MPLWGAEIDIRSGQGQILTLAHDPFKPGDNLDQWLGEYRRLGLKGPIILNTKEDGLEGLCLEKMKFHGISNFFFLDSTVPTLVKWTIKNRESRFAVRHSVFEPLAGVMNFAGKAEWVWVDCFDGNPPPVEDLKALKKVFKVCLVSPELQIGLTANTTTDISRFSSLRPYADAICTKVPEYW